MKSLHDSLVGAFGIDRGRFTVNHGFDFSKCADTNFCASNCSLTLGAQELAQYIVSSNPPGDIVLLGYSMGGLIARDVIANNRIILHGRRYAALLTLATPNLGYPYTWADRTLKCTPIIQDMDGNWRSQQSSNTPVLRPYLTDLTNRWVGENYPGDAGAWFAASGRSCENPLRNLDSTTGCRDANPFSDGVVCQDSASFSWLNSPLAARPSRAWNDPSRIHVHTNTFWGSLGSGFVLCGADTQYPSLANPPVFGPLFQEIREFINEL